VGKLSLGNSFIFQQDNDPKHTEKRVKEWLIYNVPKQLHTPPQSPDINPMEHLWDEIGRKIRTHNVRNKQQLKNAILTEWNAIDPEITKKLVNSMKKRLIDDIKARGGPTRY
jgi:dipeptidase